MSNVDAVNSLTTVDLLLRGPTINTFDTEQRTFRSLAVRDGVIVALGRDLEDLDNLVGPSTTVLQEPGLTMLPAFFDTHNHMLRAGPDLRALQLRNLRSITELVTQLGKYARSVPVGHWIVPSRSWHESNLHERRLPTAAELDAATDQHPVALRRGGHVMVANNFALRLAGIDADTPDPRYGTIVRDPAGHPTGVLIERPAFASIDALHPHPGPDEQLAALKDICGVYNSRGITSIRDPGIQNQEFAVYQKAHDDGSLTVRSTVMVRLLPEWDHQRVLQEINGWSVRTGLGDDRLRLGGLKIFVDGGVEGGALGRPYANDPSYRGHLFYDADALESIVETGVRRGWEIGCHCVGDVALDTALEAYGRVLARHPTLRPGHLAVEHAFFADARQQRRAAELGVAVTVQHPLLHDLAGNMIKYWGPGRTENVTPIRSWVASGALVSAGSDCNVADYDPLRNVHGMVTRTTSTAGRQGVDQAVDVRTAFRLLTVAGATLLGARRRLGPLAPGRLADMMAFTRDPLIGDVDDLLDLPVALTLLGGRAVHDPDGRINPLDEEKS